MSLEGTYMMETLQQFLDFVYITLEVLYVEAQRRSQLISPFLDLEQS